MHFCDFSCLLDKLLKKESILRHPPISINLLFEYETKPESKKPFWKHYYEQSIYYPENYPNLKVCVLLFYKFL